MKNVFLYLDKDHFLILLESIFKKKTNKHKQTHKAFCLSISLLKFRGSCESSEDQTFQHYKSSNKQW